MQEEANILVNDCNYVDCEVFQGNLHNHFDILHVNARSLNINYDELVSLLTYLKHNFSVIGVSETWLKPASDVTLFQYRDTLLLMYFDLTRLVVGLPCMLKKN